MSKRTQLVAARLVAIIALIVAGLSSDVDATSCNRADRCTSGDASSVSVSRRDPVITAAGDIAEREPSAATRATARLVKSIDPTIALALGDNQYPDAAIKDFRTGYDPTWGDFLSKTRPTLGNHEYESSSTAAGYFRYFGRRAPNNFYSFKVGTWHLISLDSNCAEVGCTPGTRQYEWLEDDLEEHRATCTLAYWHHPRWSSGDSAGGTSSVAPFVRLLAHAGADVLLSGHEHNYERFAPQTPAGERHRGGIVQFVVGTGGKSVSPLGSAEDNSLVRNDESFGVLRMTLHPASYEFVFKSVLGARFRDAGSRRCR